MKGLHMVAFILLVIGGLNWLLFAVAGKDIGSYVLGGMNTTLATAVYVLVGLAAISEVVTHKNNCKLCAGGMM